MRDNLNKKREDYSNITEFYLEGCVFEALNPGQYLTFGMIWNYTTKDTSINPFIDGLNPSGVLKAFKQHMDKCGVKKVTKKLISEWCEELVELGYLDFKGQEEFTQEYKDTRYKSRTAIVRKYRVSAMGKLAIQRALKQKSTAPTTGLF